MKDLVARLEDGLLDQEDVQIVAYQTLQSVATRQSASLLEFLDDLPRVIEPSVKDKLKEAKTEEPERAKDVLRAAVRSMYTMRSMQGADQCSKFANFYLRVLKTALLAQMLKEMNSASTAVAGSGASTSSTAVPMVTSATSVPAPAGTR